MIKTKFSLINSFFIVMSCSSAFADTIAAFPTFTCNAFGKILEVNKRPNETDVTFQIKVKIEKITMDYTQCASKDSFKSQVSDCNNEVKKAFANCQDVNGRSLQIQVFPGDYLNSEKLSTINVNQNIVGVLYCLDDGHYEFKVKRIGHNILEIYQGI